MTPPRMGYWLAFGAALAVYAAMVFWTLPRILDEAGGLMPFDLRFSGYGPDEARAFLAALSAEGRAVYLGPQRLLDALYPALLAVVLAGGVAALVRSRWLRVVLLVAVLGGMAADYLENARVAALLTADAVTDEAIAAASRATVAKSALTGGAMGMLLLVLARRMRERWRG